MPHAGSRAGAIGALLRTDLRRLVHDRVAIFSMLVLPVLIIIVIGTTIGGGPRHLPIGVLDQDGSAAASQLTDTFSAQGTATVQRYTDRGELERDIRTQALAGGVVIPTAFGATVAAGQPVTVTLLTPQSEGGGQAVQSVVQSAADQVGSRFAAQAFVARAVGASAGEATAAVDRVAAQQQPIAVHTRTIGQAARADDNRFSYTAPSNLVLFVFITSLAGGAALVETRRLGITRRVLAAPVKVSTILVGAGATRYLFALIQAAIVLVIGALLFKVSWGQPAGLVALVAVYALVGAGAGLLVGAVARTPEQASAIGIPAAIAMGMLGGCMWPLDVVPASLRAIGHLTPQAWAMDGFVGLIYEDKGLLGIGLQLLVLAGYAVVLLTTATLLLRRSLTRGSF